MTPPISPLLKDILACPVCKSRVNIEEQKERIVCEKCKATYKIKEGIPIMLIENDPQTGNALLKRERKH